MRKRIVFLLTLLFSLACLHTAAYAREYVVPNEDNTQHEIDMGTEDDPFVFTTSVDANNTFYIDGVAGIDEIYDGAEKDGYIGTPKVLISNGVIYDGSGMEHFNVTYQDADGKALEGKPTEVGKYTVTFTIKDGEEYKSYQGSLTLPFSIIEEPQAKYQTKKGGTWIESSFREAILCVYDGGTVRLLTDVPLEYGTVTLNKDMTITSNKSICTITSPTNKHGYLLQVKAEVKLENVILDGGSKEGLTASRALLVIGDNDTSGKLTIGAGAVLRNNKNATKNSGGGGLVLFDGECILDGGEISGNSVYAGGGIYAKAGKVTMKDGKISNNTATNGGGIYAVGVDLEINDGEISGNSGTANSGKTEGNGGGIYMRGGKWIFNGGEINENTANYGGGAYLLNMTGICEINGGEICDNTATRLGGAIHLNLSIKLNISGGTITGNKVVKQWGGGIEVAPGCELTLSGSPVIAKNTSPEETDGGLYYDYSPPSGETIFEMDEMGADAAVSWKTYMESRLGTLSGKRLLMAVPMNREAITDYDLSKQDYDSEDYDLVLIDGEMYLVERVQAEKITIDPKELKMEVGEKETLTATLTPEDTTVPITWTSSNEKIATVDNGIVTAKKAGKATITATIPNGESASCEVTVTEKESTSTASTVTSKKYKITLKDTENGMVKASHKTAKKGTIVTVMAIPDADYVLHSLTVLDRDGRKLNVTDNGDYTYSFQMTRSSVTVTAEFLAEETDPADVDTMNAVILKINDRWSWAFGDAIRNDVAPEIRNERMMLPIRFIAENLGGTVVWNTAEQKTVIVKEGNVIEIPIGQTTAYVNGEAIELDSPAYIANDRTYLPLRFVAENLDAEVIWKADTQQVYIIPHEK